MLRFFHFFAMPSPPPTPDPPFLRTPTALDVRHTSSSRHNTRGADTLCLVLPTTPQIQVPYLVEISRQNLSCCGASWATLRAPEWHLEDRVLHNSWECVSREHQPRKGNPIRCRHHTSTSLSADPLGPTCLLPLLRIRESFSLFAVNLPRRRRHLCLVHFVSVSEADALGDRCSWHR